MITLWTKSILSLPLIGLAILNLIVMLEFLGRTEKRFNPRSLRLIHRVGGICYIVLFILLSYYCLRIMRVSGQELSARAALHGLLAVATFFVLILKLLFVRFYRKYYAVVPSLGLAVFVLTLTTAATSAGYYFTMHGTPATLLTVSLEEERAQEGAIIFNSKCSGCHFVDKTDTKIGPGLKELFKGETFAVSGWPATDESFRKQLETPYQAMPPFAGLPEEDVEALLAFLHGL
jgi:cytochrome c2